MSKVFSVKDFKRGLDVRKSPLTAPAGSARILQNVVLNPGGEVEKRYAFVKMTTNPTPTVPWAWVGQGPALHVFGCPTAPAFPAGSMAVPIIPHNLADPGEPIVQFLDVEVYSTKFYVCGRSATRTYNWYDGVLVNDAAGAPVTGTYARTYKTKMYVNNNLSFDFSGVNNPAERDPADTTSPGAGFIEVSKNDPEGEPSIATEIFYNQAAIFSRLSTQLWVLDPDPNKDALQQVIRVGTVAPQSVFQFSTGDILFLSDSGVRSLKAQGTAKAAH